MAKRDKHQVVPSGMLSKEFLNQFKAEQDVSTYSGAYPFTFRQPIKHKIAFKSTILYPFIP